jgi:hypothetical protein
LISKSCQTSLKTPPHCEDISSKLLSNKH